MSRIDNLIKENPILGERLIDILVKFDPTKTYKYLPFLIKQLFKRYGKEDFNFFSNEETDSLKILEEHLIAKRITKNDISTYNTFDDVEESIKEGDEYIKRKESEKKIKKLYETEEWLVLIPLTKESAAIYGYNTKWCVTYDDYFNEYKHNIKIIYIINKKTDSKVAISFDYDKGNINSWDSADNSINVFKWEFNSDIWEVLRNQFIKTKQEYYCYFLLSEDEIITSLDEIKLLNIKDATIQQLNTFKDNFCKFISLTHLNNVNNEIITKENITSIGKKLTDHLSLYRDLYRYYDKNDIKFDYYKSYFLNE